MITDVSSFPQNHHAPNSGGLSWTPGQGIVFHMLQLGVCTPQLKEIPHATTKIQCRQIKKHILKKEALCKN